MHSEPQTQILVVDFGGQTSHLICRRLRDAGVYARIIAPSTPVFTWLAEQNESWQSVKGLILSGSPFSVYEANAPQPCDQILALAATVPTLGICYGLHWLARELGGEVEALPQKEYGPNPVEIVAGGGRVALLNDVPQRFVSWMSHADSLKSLPPQFELLGQSEQGLGAIVRSVGLRVQGSALHERILFGLQSAACPALQAPEPEQVLAGELELYGLQFHPEASHCEAGSRFLANFAHSICRCKGDWALESWEQRCGCELRRQVQTAAVVLLISGGVDSAVVAALLLRYLKPKQIYLLYFDTGLMRQGESEEVAMQLRELGARHFYQINVQDEFLSALAGVAEPEQKRRIIGDLFIEIQQREIQQYIPGTYFLAQGTLYTDMIESGMGQHAAVIKSHHNVSSPLVRKLREQGRLLEPLASLYKDEVRRLGQKLGLSRSLTQRQPFPGPGLAIRILGALNAEKLELLRGIDHLYLATLKELGVYEEIWQAFAVLLPVQSVGVTGDSRRYGPVVALRAIISSDGMSSEVYPFSHEQLQNISTRISNRFPQISRVVYDISAKPPATIEWE